VGLETAKFSKVKLLPIDETGFVGTRLRMKVKLVVAVGHERFESVKKKKNVS